MGRVAALRERVVARMAKIVIGGAAALVGVVAFGLLWIWRGYRRLAGENRARLAAGSRVVDTASGPIEYAAAGDGFPVLVSHGGAGGYDQGLITAGLYLGDGLMAIAPSRFGHLRTPLAADSSAPAQADAYVSLLDELGIERVVVLATSGGGPSALQFALRHPERLTALVMAAGVSQSVPARSTGVYRSDFGFYLANVLLRRVALRAIGVTREVEAELTAAERGVLEELLRGMHPISLRRAGLFHDIEEWADRERWTRDYPLERIEAPTLVVHAEDDVVVPFAHGQHTADSIRGARLLALPSGGHMRFGHIEDVRAEITGFVLEHASAGAATSG